MYALLPLFLYSVVELSIVELSIEGPTTVTEPENGNQSLKFTVLLSTEPNLTLGSDLMLSLRAEREGDASQLHIDTTCIATVPTCIVTTVSVRW